MTFQLEVSGMSRYGAILTFSKKFTHMITVLTKTARDGFNCHVCRAQYG